MKATKFEYFDGEKEVFVNDINALAKIMNRTNSDPDSLDVKKDAAAIAVIVRDVFKMDAKATEHDCVVLWQEFLAFMFARGMTE